jgi:integrase/recombinase XerD
MNPYKTFASYLEVEKGRSPTTIAAYLGDIKRLRAWLDEQPQQGLAIPWEQVQARHLRSYLADLEASPSYLQRVTSSLRVWFDYLREIERLIDGNPAREIAKPKKGRRHPPALSPDEVRRLIHAAVAYSRPSERLRNWTLIAVLFHTGLRISELCGLKESDIRHREGLPYAVRVIGKGNKERSVVLSGEAQRALHQWLQERHSLTLELPPGKDGAYVWLVPAGRRQGQRFKPQGVREMLKRVAKFAGLSKSVYPHLLRHTFATEAVRHGARVHALQAVLGHANLSTTSIYLHADEAELEAVAAVMPRVLEG